MAKDDPMDTELLSGTFVELADTMVADFDIIDFLHLLTERSVQLLSASAAAATGAGFRTVQAVPMRLRDEVIGALNLFGDGTVPFSPEDVRIGQALADVATIGLLQARTARRREIAAEQLQGALNSRVIIEQAKGKLAERLSIDMDASFKLLRDHARNSNQRLTDVARHFVESATADFPPPARRSPRA
jgi:GAF domain-containing protein